MQLHRIPFSPVTKVLLADVSAEMKVGLMTSYKIQHLCIIIHKMPTDTEVSNFIMIFRMLSNLRFVGMITQESLV
jgi:hypothetical protein